MSKLTQKQSFFNYSCFHANLQSSLNLSANVYFGKDNFNYVDNSNVFFFAENRRIARRSNDSLNENITISKKLATRMTRHLIQRSSKSRYFQRSPNVNVSTIHVPTLCVPIAYNSMFSRNCTVLTSHPPSGHRIASERRVRICVFRAFNAPVTSGLLVCGSSSATPKRSLEHARATRIIAR